MDFIEGFEGRQQALIDVFRRSFGDSEGEAEGRVIAQLVTNLITTTASADLRVFSTVNDGDIAGAIIFSRLNYPADERVVFLLAPVAVATARQRQGVGQALLRHGLDAVRNDGVEVAITYGDPNYYARVGFAQITEEIAQPPFKLEQPHGWLGQSLTDQPLTALSGACRCVPAFDKPEYW